MDSSQDAVASTPKSPGTSTPDGSSFFEQLGIPRMDEFAPKEEIPTLISPSIAEPLIDDEPLAHTDKPVTEESLEQSEALDQQHTPEPPNLPRLGSDNLITTCHVEDITVGCLKCQAKSAERLAAGEVTNWETIHQQHLYETDGYENEGVLEMAASHPGQRDTMPEETSRGLDSTESKDQDGDVPDTKDIGFTPEPFEKLGVSEDPFEKLKRDSIAHTASFPIVPEPQTAAADTPSNPFGTDSAADDSFFGSVQKEDKPVQASDSNFFGDEGTSGDDFFSNVDTNGVPAPPILERAATQDLAMGTSVEDEDNRFTEGMPLFSGQPVNEEDFFSRSKTPIDSSTDDDEAAFFNNPNSLKRKSTAFVSGLPEGSVMTEAAPAEKPKEDLALKWKAALGDDDDLFGDEEEEEEEDTENVTTQQQSAQPAWFDDSEDFLIDEGSKVSAPIQEPTQSSQPAVQPVSSRYLPSAVAQQQHLSGFTAASSNFQASRPSHAPSPYAAAFPAPQGRTETPKVESFVDKTSSYASPYDLPDDIVKPIRKKPAPVQQPPAYGASQYYGPPGSASSGHSGQSIFSPGPPGGLGSPADIRGRPGYGGQAAPPLAPHGRLGAPTTPNPILPKAAKPQTSDFFEELPISLPKRPASGASMSKYTPGARTPTTSAPMGPPPTSAPGMGRSPSYTGPPSRPTSVEPAYGSPPVGSLGRQQYGSSPALAHSPLAHAASAYAVPHGPTTPNYAPKPSPTAGLYASPPSATRGTSPYTQRPNAPPSAPARTSSVSSDGRYAPAHGQDNIGLGLSAPEGLANGHMPSARPPSRDRPGTMDSMKAHALGGVAEEDEEGNAPARSSLDNGPPPPVSSLNRYNPSNRQTPPPPATNPALSHLTSPPQRSQSPGKYTPTGYQTHTATSSLSSSILSPTDMSNGFAPPKRSATQSPGFAAFRSQNMHGIQRPSSAAAHATNYTNTYSPIDARRPSFPVQSHPAAPAPPPQNFMAPPPGSIEASDPLERWKGAPLFCWGFGGNIVTMFPVHTSRWNAETGQQMIKTSLGEVKNRPAKEVLNGDDFYDDLAKFPGPVFGGRTGSKGRKKEISSWMETKILKLEGEYTRFRDPRSMEKVILWKIVKLCLENDGMLVGKKEVQDAVRQIISPESETLELPRPKNALQQSSVFDSNALEAIRTHLMKGDRDAAVWFAIENRQWAHAILISSTTSPELYKRTVQEFVKQEVKSSDGAERPGMQSLAVLYEVFAGNWEESIDDLVPASTRMGMTMINTSGGQNTNPLEGLEKWRETLGLMLGNRSNNDIQAIAKLGSLLESYNRIEAAHVCYLFSMPAAIFSGAEDSSKSIFSLLGANHVNNPFHYGRDLDAIILSEIYEYALSLMPGAPTLTNFPHLLPFKLHHAQVLAQYGFKNEAQKYTEAISASFKISGRPQPYLHGVLLEGINELAQRLSQAPRDSSGGSLLSNLPGLGVSRGGVLAGMQGMLDALVNGGDQQDSSAPAGINGSTGAPTHGPISDGQFASPPATSGLDRSHSGPDLYGIGSGGYTPYNPAQPPLGTTPVGATKTASAAANRYAPKTSGAGSYTPHASTSAPQTTEPATPGYGGYGGYEPNASYGGYGYGPSPQPTPQQTPQQHTEKPTEAANGYGGYQPSPVPQSVVPTSPPQYSSHDSFTSQVPLATSDTTAPTNTSGYETPGYGYEPPTTEFQPYVPSPDNSDDESEAKKSKKKGGAMAHSDDDFGAAGSSATDSAAAAKKKKEEEEEENKKKVAAIAQKEKEEEEQRKKEAKSGGWFGGWFGGKKDPNAPVVHKAKLGDESSFYFDPETKRWVNKKGGSTTDSAGITPSGTPPPPKRLGSPAIIGGPPSRPPSGPPSGLGTPRPGTSSSIDSGGLGSIPKPPPSAPPTSAPTSAPSGGLAPPNPSPLASSRDPSPSRPPPRPATTGKIDDMEELLSGGGGPRKPAAKAKGRKRYVEVL
ncbi:hypothetical protein TWF191_005601 [Orbilia oligospora]|uniref:Protein transport protein sec16 n=1 Tax=Orbilia oligospora TaxID=2813651 RepID=A0A7C8R2Z0_ORBOL|nr:hypothetical protein TWF191_005601 [Orbilia oligospora]